MCRKTNSKVVVESVNCSSFDIYTLPETINDLFKSNEVKSEIVSEKLLSPYNVLSLYSIIGIAIVTPKYNLSSIEVASEIGTSPV